LLNAGDPSPFGQKLQGIVVKETLQKALEVSGWKKPKAKNIGRGVAVYERPSGAGKSGAAITIETNGKVSVHLGVPDVGPGIHTVVQQIVRGARSAARARQCPVEDTDHSPFDSGTGGSKSTNSVGRRRINGQ
jgi:CO/xanthine dehydrogenase Mo-binding subunit